MNHSQYQPNDASISHTDGKGIPEAMVNKYLRSQIFQGVILGWIVSISILVLAYFVGIRGQMMTDSNVAWDLRIGFVLTVVTVITRISTAIVGFMVPAILAGIIVLGKITKLDGSGTIIGKLMESYMSRGLWCTVTACFSSGPTRKLSLIIVSVLLWQYLASMADLYFHITAIGKFQQLPGLTYPSARSLDIATDCPETSYLDNCVARKRGMKNNDRVLKVYQNVSESLVLLRNDGGIYLIQSPPLEKAYSYSGSGVVLQPTCEPISSICNLKARYGASTNYSCPEELWYASGNTVTTNFNVNVTTAIRGPEKYEVSNPIHAIVTLRYAKELSTNYDSEFVSEVHGDLSFLLHCQIFASKIQYDITLGLFNASPLANLSNSQLFTLASASSLYKMVSRAINDVEDVSFKGNSTLLANEFAQQWAQATIATFSGIVQENGEGEGYSYTLEINKEQTIVPLSVVLIYSIIIILPLIIYSCVSLCSLGHHSPGVHISWILAEFFCKPQRLLYLVLIKEHYVEDDCLKSMPMQERIIRNIECSIKVDDGHFELSPKFKELSKYSQ
ncbi:14439_t:CDS:1 [Funneliformis geosporum]|uniref:8596_t:CDS:1 n=1 Tax=Funneliformis geosporum TaxID=1117311 RepID=A0A9W4SMG1_9GLOM|nr:8596_t:CDS:1 [Funneliformis geosporum]CAI2180407.1 14439_t:CDS:1 [Funneliformis geosporum]